MKKLPPSCADSCAASPTAVEAMKAVPWTRSPGSAKSTADGAAPFTCVSPPASQASTMITFASACERAANARSSS